MGIWDKWALWGKCWVFGIDEHWGKWALGANGHYRENVHQGKWTFEEMGTLGQIGTLGLMSIGASRHWEKMGTWGK